jgi:hypothetical protein
MNASTPTIAPAKSSGRVLLWLGIAVALLGAIGYGIALMKFAILDTPWYVPILATLGVCLIALSIVRRLTIWRIAALLLIGLLAGSEWWFLAVESRLQPYTGPVVPEKPFPEFSPAYQSDGTAFTRDNLVGKENTVLVFFRGFW